MPFALGLLALGLTYILSGLKGQPLASVLLGEGEPLDPAGGTSEINWFGSADPTSSSSTSPVSLVGSGVSGNPKQIIDTVVIPIARANGINVTPQSVEAANGRHSTMTTTGSVSDHKGPASRAWAADMSNGNSPTKEMDKLASDLAKRFGIPWSGSGAKSVTKGGYRYQLIYRSFVGGNHFNHVHFGVKAV